MASVNAMRLIGQELFLDGEPWRNLATFVTTWMEPEAQRIIAENLHRNYIGNAQHVTIMRALVKQTLGHARLSTLADDIVQAVATLSAKGGLHELDRQRVKTGTGY